MVDDPSANPDLFETQKEQDKERERLFRIIEDLVKWENTNNERVLQAARNEIWHSSRRVCTEFADHPLAKELFDRHKLPAFCDPFAESGSLPISAQWLGLESHARDLNPVAVLINKAMIEIPPKFTGKPPVNPEARQDNGLFTSEWKAHKVSPRTFARLDLHALLQGGQGGVCRKSEGAGYRFTVKTGKPKNAPATNPGTKSGGSGSSFLCLMSGTAIPFEYLRTEAKAGRMGARLMAIVAEGERRRVYFSPTGEMEAIALSAKPKNAPETRLPLKALGFRIQEYGMTRWRDLFSRIVSSWP